MEKRRRQQAGSQPAAAPTLGSLPGFPCTATESTFHAPPSPSWLLFGIPLRDDYRTGHTPPQTSREKLLFSVPSPWKETRCRGYDTHALARAGAFTSGGDRSRAGGGRHGWVWVLRFRDADGGAPRVCALRTRLCFDPGRSYSQRAGYVPR